jgi:hypothetical protein
MGGGIFTGRPFVLNTKCLVFSFYSSLLLYGGGGRNPLLIALIFVIAYVLLAWYDWVYECDDFMYSGKGSLGFSGIFKPQRREKNRNTVKDGIDLVSDQEQAYLNKVYFFHAFIVAPMLMYIGYYGATSNKNIWGFVGGMGGLAFMYHGVRIVYPRGVWK